MVTTITIVLIIVNVLKAMQHNVMQQYYQYLAFTHIQNVQQEVILPIDFILHVFDDLALVFYAIYPNINNENVIYIYVVIISTYSMSMAYYFMNQIL